MKPSPYNHFFPLPESDITLAYNAFNGALAEIENVHLPRIHQLLANPLSAESPQDHEFLSCLKEGGFLIPDPVDQRATLQSTAKLLRRMDSILGLTVAPTLACNFRCDYCFEAHSGMRMSAETQTALLKFCDEKLQNAEGLRVWWFGGEPTICMPILDNIQSNLLSMAAKYGAEVISGEIITNGYLLNGSLAQHLKDLQITRAQVTIDGPQEIHDRRRKLANGQGSFRQIVDNLGEASEILEIDLRINIDKDNVDSAIDVVVQLQEKGILPKVKVHFGQVLSAGAACSSIRDKCFSDVDFSRVRVDLYNKLHDMGIYIYQYPTVRVAGAACGAPFVLLIRSRPVINCPCAVCVAPIPRAAVMHRTHSLRVMISLLRGNVPSDRWRLAPILPPPRYEQTLECVTTSQLYQVGRPHATGFHVEPRGITLQMTRRTAGWPR